MFEHAYIPEQKYVEGPSIIISPKLSEVSIEERGGVEGFVGFP